MVFLALAVLCSLTIGMIFKWGARRGIDRMALLTVNYAAAAVLAGVLLARRGVALWGPADGTFWLISVVTGALFIAGFFMLSYATERAGMALSLAVMRVSVVLPVAMAWLVWGEEPTTVQTAGLVLAGMSFFLIARRPEEAGALAPPNRHAGLALGSLFFLGGLVDVLFKTFDAVLGGRHDPGRFLLVVFIVAAVIGVIFVLEKGLRGGGWPGAEAIGWGVVLGPVNYGSAAFLLNAVSQLPAPVVFPLNNVAIVLGGALLGVAVWRERLSRVNLAGLALAALALWLLSRSGAAAGTEALS